MDYKTKPISRKNVRKIACFVRNLFDVPQTGAFPILQVLDKIGDVLPGSRYEIVEDKEMSDKTMAYCLQNEDGGYTIKIKSSVYDGAYERNIGAYLGFICHELCHVVLFKLGFKPIFERSFSDNELPAYCSVEWQAKALCGELMIPYIESIGMVKSEIMCKYGVSEGFANMRIKL